MTDQSTNRRDVLRGLGALGCSAAAWPLTTTMTFAAAPWDARLVVIILRGAMDGLDVVRPVGDANFAALRAVGAAESTPLDGGFFALHPSLRPLGGLWRAGELGFVHAVSTPYRDKRSHFDGQDLLEAGTGGDTVIARDGWLNRMLQAVPGVTGETAFAIGRENMKILVGDAPVANWAPDTPLNISPQAQELLQHAYGSDPLFHAAANEAVVLAASVEGMQASPRGRPEQALAAFAADRLNGATRVAAFSIGGWDTHRNQTAMMGNLLPRLAETILTLKRELGANWSKTAVLAMTEFGRTARMNGSGGTDHGTGGAMLIAGGTVRGGRVYGRWPGLAEADLYARRDLNPTGDLRAVAGWTLRHLAGLDRSVIEGSIFPGLDLGDDPGVIL